MIIPWMCNVHMETQQKRNMCGLCGCYVLSKVKYLPSKSYTENILLRNLEVTKSETKPRAK